MKNGTGQLTLVLLLMLALFLQIEGVVPDIFASNEEPLLVTREKDGLEFKVMFKDKSFTEKNELLIKADITNKTDRPISYFSTAKSYGVFGAIGAAMSSIDGAYKFTDKFAAEAASAGTNGAVLEGELMPGETINCEFTMLPYFFDEGEKNIAAPGDYILKIRYNRNDAEAIEAEVPVILVKRFGKMYLRV